MLTCGFCGKTTDEVSRLLVTHDGSARICDYCVLDCVVRLLHIGNPPKAKMKAEDIGYIDANAYAQPPAAAQTPTQQRGDG